MGCQTMAGETYGYGPDLTGPDLTLRHPHLCYCTPAAFSSLSQSLCTCCSLCLERASLGCLSSLSGLCVCHLLRKPSIILNHFPVVLHLSKTNHLGNLKTPEYGPHTTRHSNLNFWVWGPGICSFKCSLGHRAAG